MLGFSNSLYYDFSAAGPGYQTAFTSVLTHDVSLPGTGVMPPPIIGDVNGDRIVNLADLNVITSNWLAIGVTPSGGDINLDGVVNLLDANLVIGNWLATDAHAPASLAVVPEPTSLLPIAAAAAIRALARRRKRRRTFATLTLAAASLLLPAASSAASTIEAQLVAIKTSPSMFDVQVWARSDNLSTAFPAGDGGIASFQFDVSSDGTGLSAPLPDPLNSSRVRNAFAPAISSSFTTIAPVRTDGVTAYGYVSDGDPDSLGGAILDPGGYHNTTLGLNNAYTLVSTQQWQLTTAGHYTGDHLSLRVIGPTYYDYSNQTPGSINRQYFTTAVVHGAALDADSGPGPGPSFPPSVNAYLTYHLSSATTADVDLYAKVTGTPSSAGGGGLASLQFDIKSTDNAARPTKASGLSTHAQITWDPVVSANFSTAAPTLADATGAPITSSANAGNARQALGGSFADSFLNYEKTDFGLDQYVHVATEQWELLGGGVLFPLSLTISNATAYDFNNGDPVGGYRDAITQINATGVLIDAFVPEPVILTPALFCTALLVRRDRRTA